MFPILFKLGSFEVPAWHVFFVLAAMAAYLVFAFLARKQGSAKDNQINMIFVLGYVGGYFGARLFSILFESKLRDVHSVTDFFVEWLTPGAMTMYGGVVGCFLLTSIYVRKQKLPYARLCDAGFIGGILAVGVGRIGCFLNGDDYGEVISGYVSGSEVPWWAVEFPNHSEILPRYPVQIWEAIFCIVLSFILMKRLLLHPDKRPGSIGIMAVGGYAVFRFFVEFYRGDERGWIIENLLSPAQLISISIIAGCLGIAYSQPKRQTKEYEESAL